MKHLNGFSTNSSYAARQQAFIQPAAPVSNNLAIDLQKQRRDFSNTIRVPEIKKPNSDAFPIEGELSKSYPLLNDRNVKIFRELKWVEEGIGRVEVVKDRLVIETSNYADTVHVIRAKHGGIDIIINGKTYHADNQSGGGKLPEIHIKTNGGNDHVWVDADVTTRMLIETGDGADYIQAGAGYTRVLAGAGNDTVRLGSGIGYAQGDDGDDTLIGGSGMCALYGNNGRDKMYAGYFANTKRTYMDGGRGSDEMYAKSGKTIMHGGIDNDLMVSCGNSHIYTGKGQNKVVSLSDSDVVFSNGNDTVKRTAGSKLVEALYSDVGREALRVTGSKDYIQRVEDDLELLKSSPVGRQMLRELDAAFRRNTVPSIDKKWVELIREETKNLREVQRLKINNLDEDNGKFFNREIGYNPSFVDSSHLTFPISILYHEMAHAYNRVNKSELKGQTRVNDGATGLEENIERQAVGLWTDAKPFDFDKDPSTPPTSTNPKPFTENSLHEEMGEPLRTAYKIENVVREPSGRSR